MSELRVEDLVVRYGDVTAVRGVDLHVREGEFVTLLGPSGCGKTTTLRCIAGLEPRAGGTIHIGGELVSGPGREVSPENRNINMVFQTYAVWPHMTVGDNVAFGLKLRRLSRADVRRRLDEALKLVGLAEYRDRYGTELSGGQQQRVALARAIVTEPRLLLFDEPLSNLDASLREQMRLELRELHQRLGKTAIYVTHDQVEAMVMSDRVVLMREGRIVQVGTPAELYECPTSRFAADFLGMSNIWDGAVGDVSPETGRPIVALDDGLRLEASVPPGTAVPSQGQIGAVGARAERVELRRQAGSGRASGTNLWSGVIERRLYLGGRMECHVRIGERLVRAQTGPAMSFEVGDRVDVSAPAETVVWLPEQPTEQELAVDAALTTGS